MAHVGVKLEHQLQKDVTISLSRTRSVAMTKNKSIASRKNIADQANALLLKGMVPGKPLSNQIGDCKKQIAAVNSALKQIDAETKSSVISSSNKSSIRATPTTEKSDLKETLQSLEGMLILLESYQSPTSVKNICIAKLLELEAARAAIPATDKNNQPINQNLHRFIDARISYIKSIHRDPEEIGRAHV